MHLISRGKFDSAKKYTQRAQIIDPLSDFTLLVGQYADFCKMKFDLVADRLKKFLNSDPPFWWGLWFLWRTLSLMNRKPEAVEVCKKSFSVIGSVDIVQSMETTGVENALKTAALKMTEVYRDHYTSPYDIAILFIHAELKDEALKWLEESIEVIDPKTHFLNADPDFQSIRNDERFINCLIQVGFEK